ncbi:MAG: glucosaminidase domain-containing protein [Mariprofundaceae bacterium]
MSEINIPALSRKRRHLAKGSDAVIAACSQSDTIASMQWSRYVLLLSFFVAACAPKSPPEALDVPLAKVVHQTSAADIDKTAQKNTAAGATGDVGEKPEVVDVHTRKTRFFAMLRPLVEAENTRILTLRQQLLSLQKQRQDYSENQLLKIQIWAKNYRVPLVGKPQPAFWVHLLKRVDAVPLELALAQAANESAWGTSRFARLGNNFFGQWCYTKDCGIVPARRNAGASHEVRVFASAGESVRAYIHNLNTTKAYRSLRRLRLHLRRSGQALDARLLAGGLSAYSERGAAYVKSIRTMIRVNQSLMRPKGSKTSE